MKTQGIKEQLERIREALSSLPADRVEDAMKDVDGIFAVLCEIEAAQLRAFIVRGQDAVSHYTRPMVARVLKVNLSSIHERVKRGTLKSVIRDGEVLVPSWAVARALEKNEERKKVRGLVSGDPEDRTHEAARGLEVPKETLDQIVNCDL